MTTIRDVRELVAPLVKKRGDLHWFDRYLVRVPIRTGFAAIFFERSGDPDIFRTCRIAIPLCSMSPRMPPPQGRWLMRPNASPEPGWGPWAPWRKSDPDYPEALREAIEREFLPPLEGLQSIRDFFDWIAALGGLQGSDHLEHRVFVEIAYGDFDAAALHATKDFWSLSRNACNEWQTGLGDRLVEQGDALSTEDKQALIAMLHRREEDAVRALKLEKNWERTPFPAEEKGLA